MQKQFVQRLMAIFLLVIFLMSCADLYIVSRLLEEQSVTHARSASDRLHSVLEANEEELKVLKESLDEDYLTRCHALAYIIAQHPGILLDRSEMERVRDLLGVDEFHVIDAYGFLRWGTEPRYYNMDYDDSDQTREFLQILKDPKLEIIQEIQPDDTQQIAQFIAVAREDAPGIVQIGLKPQRYLEAAARNEISYIIQHSIAVDGEYLFTASAETGLVTGTSDGRFVGQPVTDMGIGENYAEQFRNGRFVTLAGERSFLVTDQKDDRIIGVAVPADSISNEMWRQVLTMLACLLVLSGSAIAAISYMVSRSITQGVYSIVDGMNKIRQGDLNTVVRVDSSPEFRALSDGINQMVGQIIRERDFDALTGLRSRRSFEKTVNHAMQSKRNVAFFMMDLDNFKNINDTYGHAFGDTYLRELAHRLEEVFSPDCILGRRSGDEFYICWPGCTGLEAAENRIQKLYESLEGKSLMAPDQSDLVIHITAGVTVRSGSDLLDYDALVGEADVLLYQAKEKNKGRYLAHSSLS